jgi:hypothetical protein
MIIASGQARVVTVRIVEALYKRVGVMLGDVVLSKKKRPDVVDALVALTAARHDPAAVITCDEGDITAYLNTIPRTRVVVIPL